MVADRLVLTYQSEIKMQDVHGRKFESDIEDYLAKIVKFIKKEYKNITKDSLSLEKIDKPLIRVETVSRQRTWVVAKQEYKVGRVEMEDTGESERVKMAAATKKWLEKSTEKKPENVKIKPKDNQKDEE
jgi:hypothetical protein